MDTIDITFDIDDAKRYLKAWGFTLKKCKVSCSRSVYHNDVECWEEDGIAVSKPGTRTCLPSQHTNAVLEVFEREFRKRLFEKLT